MDEQEQDAKELSAYQSARVETLKECKELPVIDCVKRMARLESRMLEAKDLMHRLNGEYDVLRTEIIPGKMEDAGLQNMKVTGIGQVVLTADAMVSVKAGLKVKLFAWFRKNNLDDVIKEDINASTLKSFVKNRLKKGEPIPDELLNVTPITRASITKKA